MLVHMSEINVVGQQPHLASCSIASSSMAISEAGAFDSQLDRPSLSPAISTQFDHRGGRCSPAQSCCNCSSIEANLVTEGRNINSQDIVASSTVPLPRSTAARSSSRQPCWRPLAALALGQLLSLLITASGFASSHLARVGINTPITQSFCTYALLALVYGTLLLYRRKELQVPWFWYVLLAIVDVEANYLAVRAYQYTSITSVMLLDRGSLILVLALTWIIFKSRYNFGQLGGIGVCLGGVVILFLSDVQPQDNADTNKLIKGDVLVLSASILYAISNVVEEFLARKNDFIEMMAALGFFGSIISASQLFIFEISTLRSTKWNLFTVMSFMGFAASLFTFYALVPYFLKMDQVDEWINNAQPIFDNL